MDQQQQQEIAAGLLAGETRAWRALYDAHCEAVWCCVARRMGSNSADVADVVQETFLAAARSARHYDPTRGSLSMWLGGIARRQVALSCRQKQRQQRLTADNEQGAADRERLAHGFENREGSAEEVLATTESALLVRQTLGRLSANYEVLLTAKYFDGATAQEIADAQQSSVTSVRSKLARARRAFRRAFAKVTPCSMQAPSQQARSRQARSRQDSSRQDSSRQDSSRQDSSQQGPVEGTP